MARRQLPEIRGTGFNTGLLRERRADYTRATKPRRVRTVADTGRT
jgi:hypothetical protein